ncbi:MAG: ABC transporter substrate-binding protein [Dongiaceae bacterium]
MSRSNSRISRRRFVAGAGAVGVGAATGLLAAPRIARAEGKITVLNWQGYGTDEAFALEAFKKANGIDVVHDYFNSEQEMITKLRTNPGAYDVVLTNAAWNGMASSEGLVQPIDASKIAHFGDLSPALRDSPMLGANGKVFGVSWVWGMTAIAYNTEKFNPAPDSVEVLWDPANAKRVSVRDDAVEAVSYGAIATGQDMNHPADLGKVKEKLLALKPQIATLWSSEDEWNKLFQSGTFDVSVYWSGSAARSKTNFKLPVGYMVPKEGGIGWFDGLAVAAGAPNVDGANKFIDYMVDPAFYVEWATTAGAPASANIKANEGLPADDVGRQIHSDQAAIGRLQFMSLLSDEERQTYSDLWTEVKAEFAK